MFSKYAGPSRSDAMQQPCTHPCPGHSRTIYWIWVSLWSPRKEMTRKKRRQTPLKLGAGQPDPRPTRPSCFVSCTEAGQSQPEQPGNQTFKATVWSHSSSTIFKTVLRIPASWAQGFTWQRSSTCPLRPLWSWLPSPLSERSFSAITSK